MIFQSGKRGFRAEKGERRPDRTSRSKFVILRGKGKIRGSGKYTATFAVLRNNERGGGERGQGFRHGSAGSEARKTGKCLYRSLSRMGMSVYSSRIH